MKKFRFSLETVLDYKNQALDALRAEHGAILAQVRAQERVIADLGAEHREADQSPELRHTEERKRDQVVEARKETATIEKLKEHKLEDYRKAEQKDEEQRIEEFVSTTRAMAAMGI